MKQAATLIEPHLSSSASSPARQRVWAYLTIPKARHFSPAGVRPARRRRIQLEFHQRTSPAKRHPERPKRRGRAVRGTITAPLPRACSLLRTIGSTNSEVTFELQPRGKEVLLVITHRRIDGRERIISIASGWDTHTGILADVLNGTQPRPFWSTHANLEKEYAAQL